MKYHQPVLLSESIDSLDPGPNKTFIDATLGHAGHTLELLKRGAIVFGLDADPINLKIATKRIKSENLDRNFHPISGNFGDIQTIWQDKIKIPLDGLIADLGLSSSQQSGENRGFSFNDSQSLDMRLNPKQSLTAEEIINTWDRDELYQLFTKFAQEKLARPLVYEIIQARQIKPIKTGQELSKIIASYYQKKHYSTRLNPATKIFLALRIAVNQEFSNLKTLLDSSLIICQSGAKVAIISFHSGEDRIIKSFIRENNLVSQKSLPTHFEIAKNPLSRSSILRSYTIK